MSNPIGRNFFEGVLGVVSLTFDSLDLGYTLDDTAIEFVESVKDIKFAQLGTESADKIPTGQAYKITCKIAQITNARLNKLLRGFELSGSGLSAKLGHDIYRSGYDNFAKKLVVTRVDSEGVRSTNPLYRLVFYKAFPTVKGGLGNFGPDVQRSADVEFYCFYDRARETFGYQGYNSSVNLSA